MTDALKGLTGNDLMEKIEDALFHWGAETSFENSGGGNYVIEVNCPEIADCIWISGDEGSFGWAEKDGAMSMPLMFCAYGSEVAGDPEVHNGVTWGHREESVRYFGNPQDLIDHLLTWVKLEMQKADELLGR